MTIEAATANVAIAVFAAVSENVGRVKIGVFYGVDCTVVGSSLAT